MKKPVVDYRTFRLSRINEPQFSHLKLLAGWLVYFAMYFITENVIPLESCHVVHCRLDDIVPFNEYFVIAYVFWYIYIVISLGYFMLYNIESFRELSIYIIVTQAVAMAVYILYPNRQDLRPEVFPRENVCTWILSLIYAADTSSNVCPSLHVAYSIGIASVWLKMKDVSKWLKAAITIVAFIICISVSFVKQHSVVDIFAAIPVCLLAEWLIFGKKYWKPKFKRLLKKA